VNGVQAILEEARKQYLFSAYQLAGVWGEGSFSFSGGISSYWPGGSEISDGTLFDIGSVTKAVATTSLFARAVDRKALSLEDILGKFIPELKGTAYEGLVLADLLCHAAGVRWWFPFYQEKKPFDLLRTLKSEEKALCEAKPGTKTVYSDVGFCLLGLVLEKIGGPLKAQFAKEVSGPLKLRSTKYGPVTPPDCVATEFHIDERRLIHGEVFDENARFMGGQCAHAGLFSTAADLVLLGKEWLAAGEGRSKWLGTATVQRFTRAVGRVPGSTWAVGWDTRSRVGSSAGNLLSLRSFGHLGYPGCSVWIDPDVSAVIVFLSNRVHPSRLDERIRGFRPKLHDAVALSFSRP